MLNGRYIIFTGDIHKSLNMAEVNSSQVAEKDVEKHNTGNFYF